jgi:malate synthase
MTLGPNDLVLCSGPLARGTRGRHRRRQRHDDRRSLLEALAPAFGCTADEAIDIPFTLVGTVDDMREAVLRRRERWGFTYTIVPDDAMEAFAPVVAELAGQS